MSVATDSSVVKAVRAKAGLHASAAALMLLVRLAAAANARATAPIPSGFQIISGPSNDLN